MLKNSRWKVNRKTVGQQTIVPTLTWLIDKKIEKIKGLWFPMSVLDQTLEERSMSRMCKHAWIIQDLIPSKKATITISFRK